MCTGVLRGLHGRGQPRHRCCQCSVESSDRQKTGKGKQESGRQTRVRRGGSRMEMFLSLVYVQTYKKLPWQGRPRELQKETAVDHLKSPPTLGQAAVQRLPVLRRVLGSAEDRQARAKEGLEGNNGFGGGGSRIEFFFIVCLCTNIQKVALAGQTQEAPNKDRV